jgi:hypothetical protein
MREFTFQIKALPYNVHTYNRNTHAYI